MIPRCDTCHKRHATDDDECAEPGEDGHMSRDELISAFRMRCEVCLTCQAVWHHQGGTHCPWCRGRWEQFAEDDLAECEVTP